MTESVAKIDVSHVGNPDTYEFVDVLLLRIQYSTFILYSIIVLQSLLQNMCIGLRTLQ